MTIRLNTLAGKRVLIAEDVATCATVKGAVDCVGEMAIDVAVIDFMLADGNSQPLQAALNRKHIPFVVVSAYPRPLVRTEPDQEILQKPVTYDLLCGRVEAACKLAA